MLLTTKSIFYQQIKLIRTFKVVKKNKKMNNISQYFKRENKKNSENLILFKENEKKYIDNKIDDELIIIDEIEKDEINVKETKKNKDANKTEKVVKKPLKPENYRILEKFTIDDLIFFDLETGGMASREDILQVGAINNLNKEFNMYATPTKPIPGRSTAVHKITSKNDQMFYRKKPVTHSPLLDVLLEFIDYINSTKSNKIVLVAHNVNFDRRFLIEKLFMLGLQDQLKNKVIGFLDTLPLFKFLVPNRSTYKQESLVENFFPDTDTDFHNALTDVIYLKKLFKIITTDKSVNLNNFTQSLEYALLKREPVFYPEIFKKKVVVKKAEVKKTETKRKRTTKSGVFVNGEHIPLVKRRSVRIAKNKK